MCKCTCIVALVVGMLSCAPTTKQINQSMDAWIEHHQSELYQAWGPPTQITEDGNGGSILIYQGNVNLGQQPGQIKTASNGTTYYTTPQNVGYTRTRMFYVDSSGKIYGHKWQGK